MKAETMQIVDDPAARRIVADLRRQLEEAALATDRLTAHQMEVAALRERIDALTAARRADAAAARRRVEGLEAAALAAAGHEARVAELEAEVAVLSEAKESSDRLAVRAADDLSRLRDLLGAERERVRRLAARRGDEAAAQAAEIERLNVVVEQAHLRIGELEERVDAQRGLLAAMGADRSAADLEQLVHDRVTSRESEAAARLAARLARQQQVLEERDVRLADMSERLTAAEEALAEALAAAAPPPIDSHDLQQVRGIGPALEQTLNSLGFRTLADIAAMDEHDLARVDDALEAFRGRALRDDWPGQAAGLLEEASGGSDAGPVPAK